jgi:hypothetical protein
MEQPLRPVTSLLAGEPSREPPLIFAEIIRMGDRRQARLLELLLRQDIGTVSGTAARRRRDGPARLVLRWAALLRKGGIDDAGERPCAW